MKWLKSLPFLTIALASQSLVVRGDDDDDDDDDELNLHSMIEFPDYVECFEHMREDGLFHWPLAETSLCDVSSVFGPAVSSCADPGATYEEAYKFNRGVAIHGSVGSEVRAPYAGKVFSVRLVPEDDSYTVVMEHEFPEKCQIQGFRTKVFYTTLAHLQSVIVDEDEDLIVSGGTPLGSLGKCSRHCGTSLLFGLRVGQSCSLEYAKKFKEQNGVLPDCNNRPYDPAVNPLLLSPFPSQETAFTLHESSCWGAEDEGAMEVDSLKIASSCTGADINKYEVDCGTETYVIDFNEREGFDALNVHDVDMTKPHIRAHPYKHNSEEWVQELVIPDEYFHAAGGEDCCSVTVYDIWGNTEQKEVCGTSRSYISMFEQMGDEGAFVWPLPESGPHMMYSPFGIRSEQAGSMFHKGLDIKGYEGDDVLAIATGKVVTRTTYSRGGKSIVLEHEFPEATKLNIDCGTGDRIVSKKFYTQYQHLNSWAVKKGDIVEAGDKIGEVGQTGDEVSPLLHLELRFGTKCSLGYCVKPENVDKDCCQHGFDPMVHPALLFEKEDDEVEFEEWEAVNPDQEVDGKYNLHTRSHQGTINVFDVMHVTASSDLFDCADPDSYTVKQSHHIDLNLRQGFHGPDNDQYTDSPYLEGYGVGNIPENDYEAYHMEWRVNYVVPHPWMDEIEVNDYIIIAIKDLWGIPKCAAYPVF